MSGNGARQWRGVRPDEEEDETESSQGRSTPQRSSNAGSGSYAGGSKSSVGPPPSYDGDRSAGAWDEYRIRARLWLRTTPIEERARGPRMLQALTGQAFESMKHLADSDEWMEDPSNGQALLDEMANPVSSARRKLNRCGAPFRSCCTRSCAVMTMISAASATSSRKRCVRSRSMESTCPIKPWDFYTSSNFEWMDLLWNASSP